MYKYVFITWLLANLIHPVIAMIYFGGLSDFLDSGFVSVYGFIFIYVLFISSVSLLISFLVVSVVLKLKISDRNKFLCWLILTPAIIVANLMVLTVIGNGNGILTFSDAEIGIPALISVVAVILVRYNYFIKMCEESRVVKADEEL